MLADALLSLERLEAAARHYRALTQQAPDDPKAWYGLERSYEGLSRRAFETLQETTPGSPYLSLLVADAMVAQERDKSAFPLYREAIAKKARPGRGPRGPGPDLRAQRPRGLGRGRAREGEGRSRRPTAGRRPWSASSGPAGTRRSSRWPGRSAPRRAATGPRAPPDELAREAFDRLTALPPSPEAALVRVEMLRAQRRYAAVEGGAAEGGRGVAGGPAPPPRARDARSSSPTSTRRPGRSSRSC